MRKKKQPELLETKKLKKALTEEQEKSNEYLNRLAYLQADFENYRKRIEKNLQKFKTISDNAAYGSIITDIRGNIIYANESFASMHEYSVDEIIGENILKFFKDGQMNYFQELSQKLYHQGLIIPIHTI